MASGGTIQVDVQVTGYWQVCPICGGCGTVPPAFYSQMTMGTSAAREQCRRCAGTGTIETPNVTRGMTDPPQPAKQPSWFSRFTDDGDKTLELSLREALSTGFNYIAPEHIMLALLRQDGEVARQLRRNTQNERIADDLRASLVAALRRPS